MISDEGILDNKKSTKAERKQNFMSKVDKEVEQGQTNK